MDNIDNRDVLGYILAYVPQSWPICANVCWNWHTAVGQLRRQDRTLAPKHGRRLFCDRLADFYYFGSTPRDIKSLLATFTPCKYDICDRLAKRGHTDLALQLSINEYPRKIWPIHAKVAVAHFTQDQLKTLAAKLPNSYDKLYPGGSDTIFANCYDIDLCAKSGCGIINLLPETIRRQDRVMISYLVQRGAISKSFIPSSKLLTIMLQTEDIEFIEFVCGAIPKMFERPSDGQYVSVDINDSNVADWLVTRTFIYNVLLTAPADTEFILHHLHRRMKGNVCMRSTRNVDYTQEQCDILLNAIEPMGLDGLYRSLARRYGTAPWITSYIDAFDRLELGVTPNDCVNIGGYLAEYGHVSKALEIISRHASEISWAILQMPSLSNHWPRTKPLLEYFTNWFFEIDKISSQMLQDLLFGTNNVDMTTRQLYDMIRRINYEKLSIRKFKLIVDGIMTHPLCLGAHNGICSHGSEDLMVRQQHSSFRPMSISHYVNCAVATSIRAMGVNICTHKVLNSRDQDLYDSISKELFHNINLWPTFLHYYLSNWMRFNTAEAIAASTTDNSPPSGEIDKLMFNALGSAGFKLYIEFRINWYRISHQDLILPLALASNEEFRAYYKKYFPDQYVSDAAKSINPYFVDLIDTTFGPI